MVASAVGSSEAAAVAVGLSLVLDLPLPGLAGLAGLAGLLSPAVGDALQRLGAAVRYRTALPDRAREMAILLVAARWDSAFEREAHEAVG
ncbi:MAG TPA: hypothetical protein VGD85_04425, partial [Nocardioides sp.]